MIFNRYMAVHLKFMHHAHMRHIVETDLNYWGPWCGVACIHVRGEGYNVFTIAKDVLAVVQESHL
jgi:hypothetical protein